MRQTRAGPRTPVVGDVKNISTPKHIASDKLCYTMELERGGMRDTGAQGAMLSNDQLTFFISKKRIKG